MTLEYFRYWDGESEGDVDSVGSISKLTNGARWLSFWVTKYCWSCILIAVSTIVISFGILVWLSHHLVVVYMYIHKNQQKLCVSYKGSKQALHFVLSYWQESEAKPKTSVIFYTCCAINWLISESKTWYLALYEACINIFVLSLYIFVVNIAILVFNVYCCFYWTSVFIQGNN